MRNLESRENHNPVQDIRQQIENVESLIEDELKRSPANDWLACFNTRLFVKNLAELYVEQELISKEKWGTMKAIFDDLSKKSSELRKEIQDGKEISKETKDEMISEFKSVLDFLENKNVN